MKLLVLRHADAQTEADTDKARPLSPKGEEQSRRVASLCKKTGHLPDVILHSPLLRSRQTAEIFGRLTALPRLIEVGWLSCGMNPERALEELGAYAEFTSVMIVGHEPDLSRLLAALLGMPDSAALHIRKSSLTCVSLSALSAGCGVLEYLVPAKLLPS